MRSTHGGVPTPRAQCPDERYARCRGERGSTVAFTITYLQIFSSIESEETCAVSRETPLQGEIASALPVPCSWLA